MDTITIIEEIAKRKNALERLLSISPRDRDATTKAIDENVKSKRLVAKIKQHVKQVEDAGVRAILEEMAEDLVCARAKLLSAFLGIAIPGYPKVT